MPPLRIPVDHDPGPVTGHRGKLRHAGRVGDDVPDLPAGHPVHQVGRLQQRGRRDDHRAELHRGQDDFPQRHDVAEHQQHPVAPSDAEVAQPRGHLRRPGRQFRVRQRHVGPVVGQDPQRRKVGVLGRDHVEPVQCPVELVEHRPLEGTPRRVVVVPVMKQQVACCPERVRRRSHAPIVAATSPRREDHLTAAYWSRDRADNRDRPGRTRAGQRTTQAHRRALRLLRRGRAPGRMAAHGQPARPPGARGPLRVA